MEWLTLLILVPAIVIPVVLLLGFAGCGFSVPASPTLSAPVLTSALPLDETTIRLEWTNPEMAEVRFEIVRVPAFATPPPEAALVSPFFDTSLTSGEEYAYKVRLQGVATGTFSQFSETATARTWADAFVIDLGTVGVNLDLAADTLVQRFDTAALARGGNLINVSMRAGSNGPLVVGKVTLSEADPAPTADPFDSAQQPLEIAGPFTIDQGTELSTQTKFVVDPAKPLLVAFDVAAPGNTRSAPATGCTEFRKQGTPAVPITDAALKDRAGFTTRNNQVTLVSRIKVATEWLTS
jgi:hypothetical protein